jgi:hopanoid biosynthesis associated protein HpnK
LIVTADDFGRSASHNEAVVRAHRDGILTTASLMVSEEGFPEAIELARQHPRLGVGLHLTLLGGHPTLPPEQIPGLTRDGGCFSDAPVRTGFRYFARPKLAAQLQAEMDAQFARFHSTGLSMDHVNGHLHLHLHPTVFRILMANAARWGIRRLRLTVDPFWLNARLTSGRWFSRAVHALIFRLLSARARPVLRQLGIKHTKTVFGLLQNAEVCEDYLLRLLPLLPEGDSELYSHPSLDHFRPELEALISPRVKALLARENIQLIRYQDL